MTFVGSTLAVFVSLQGIWPYDVFAVCKLLCHIAVIKIKQDFVP